MSSLTLAQELIRSSDELKAVIDVSQIVSSDGGLQNSEEARRQCVLLVVSHKDDWDLTEEGWYVPLRLDLNFRLNILPFSLFICKRRWSNSIASTTTGHSESYAIGGPKPDELDIYKVLPIYGEFYVSMKQMKRETLQLSSTTTSSAVSRSVLDQPRSGVTISFPI